MGKLAITGGEPLRKAPFTTWPTSTEERELTAPSRMCLPARNGVGSHFPASIRGKPFAKEVRRVSHREVWAMREHGNGGDQAGTQSDWNSGPGDEVIAPAYTLEGTVGPVLLMNAVPVFVDIDPDTYCLDAKLVEKAITPKRRRFFPFISACAFRTWTKFCASPKNTI